MVENEIESFENSQFNDDDEALLIENSYKENSEETRSKIAINFQHIESEIQLANNPQFLMIEKCPTMLSVIDNLSTFSRKISTHLASTICLYFKVIGKLENLNENDFLKLAIFLKKIQKPFAVLFESISDNSGIFYWRLKEDPLQIFTLHIPENSIGLCNFVKTILIKLLKDGKNVIHHSTNHRKIQLQVPVLLSMLVDNRDYDLLFLAVESAKLQLVQYLSNVCDINHVVGGKTAADIAYEKKYHEILLILLKANSRFPVNFKLSSDDTSLPRGLRRFLLTSKIMHDAILSRKISDVLHVIEDNQTGLKFFFNTSNESALAIAIKTKSFEIYRLMLAKNLSIGPHEFLEDIFQELTKDERSKLSEVVEGEFKCIADKHIFILMANTNVGPDDKERQNRLTHVCQAFLKLNTIPRVKLILETVAATRKFQLTFDFNRENVQFLNPKAKSNNNGFLYLNGKIFIGAKDLLDESKVNKVLGVIAHEFSHYVMFKVFDNLACPYKWNDVVNEEKFSLILDQCKKLKGSEKIIDSVFDYYKDKEHPAELIVRIPQILAHYIDQPEEVKELEENFIELSRYYNEECDPVIRQKLPGIEKESETRIRKEYAMPVVKLYWKRILALILMIIVMSVLLMFLFYPCLLKSCGTDPDSFCKVNGFCNPVCDCHHGEIWEDGFCYKCRNDEDCHTNHTCFKHECIENNEIFNCQNKIQNINVFERCDGKFDCADRSDETYHCAYGWFKNNFTFIFTKSIKAKDFMINSTFDEEVDSLYAKNQKTIFYLPIQIYKKFPKLFSVQILSCSLKSIMVLNFKNLSHLKFLYLQENRIEFIEENSFDNLTSLQVLKLNNNKLVQIPSNAFYYTEAMTVINMKHNLITTLENDAVINLKRLEGLYLDNNNITHLLCNFTNNIFIQYVSLSNNPVKFIHKSAVELPNGKKISYINFLDTRSCINKCYGHILLNGKIIDGCLPLGWEGKTLMINALKKCSKEIN